jgi:hypothetical protein
MGFGFFQTILVGTICKNGRDSSGQEMFQKSIQMYKT